MDRYRVWVRSVVSLLQEELFDLLCVEPTVLPPLAKVTDNINNRTPRYSFRTEPQNNGVFIAARDKYLADALADSGCYRGCSWTETVAARWLLAADQFIGGLLLAMQLTGGMPARAPELLSVKTVNTNKSLRNIMVYNGRLATFISYNKAKSS
jgi:hypothetical protein